MTASFSGYLLSVVATQNRQAYNHVKQNHRLNNRIKYSGVVDQGCLMVYRVPILPYSYRNQEMSVTLQLQNKTMYPVLDPLSHSILKVFNQLFPVVMLVLVKGYC